MGTACLVFPWNCLPLFLQGYSTKADLTESLDMSVSKFHLLFLLTLHNISL